MNWEVVNALASIIGALAVVGTLWYVALQMRQSTQQSHANNLQTALNRWVDIQHECMETTETAELFRNGLNNYPSLTEAEKMQFNGLMLKLAASFHSILVLYQKNLWDKESFSVVENAMVGYLSCPGALAWFREVQFTYPKSVVDHLERAIEASDAPPLTQSFPPYRIDD